MAERTSGEKYVGKVTLFSLLLSIIIESPERGESRLSFLFFFLAPLFPAPCHNTGEEMSIRGGTIWQSEVRR